ncbi:unnamed protein product [Arctia plantaginis]|uniref:Uncharacterized protein n=1 Tax=Arctia plantaginis TaxID=874455 RepID=A0A8S1BBF4_ARCPL|nr:unnamed protein product [Arctia plantaginis]
MRARTNIPQHLRSGSGAALTQTPFPSSWTGKRAARHRTALCTPWIFICITPQRHRSGSAPEPHRIVWLLLKIR